MEFWNGEKGIVVTSKGVLVDVVVCLLPRKRPVPLMVEFGTHVYRVRT